MLILENIQHEDLKKYIREFYNYAVEQLEIDRSPRIIFKKSKSNADDMFGKTGYYDPDKEEICLYILDRHAKDILRSFAHELVHHEQKCRGMDSEIDLSKTSTDPAYAMHDEDLREMEREAFERGNMLFRDWCDTKKMERKNNMKESTQKQRDVVAGIKKSLKKQEPGIGREEAEKRAHKIKASMEKKGYVEQEMDEMSYEKSGLKNPQKADLDEPKNKDISAYELKRGKAIEKSIKKEAGTGFGEGPEDVQKLSEVKKMKCESCGSMYEEGKEHACKEAKNESKNIPYPELFAKKERLFDERFSQHEQWKFEELLKRAINKK